MLVASSSESTTPDPTLTRYAFQTSSSPSRTIVEADVAHSLLLQDMDDRGFDQKIYTDWKTGFIHGGNRCSFSRSVERRVSC